MKAFKSTPTKAATALDQPARITTDYYGISPCLSGGPVGPGAKRCHGAELRFQTADPVGRPAVGQAGPEGDAGRLAE